MHAEVKIGNSMLMLADENPERGHLSPKTLGGPGVSIMFYTDDVDATFKKAVDAGSKTESTADGYVLGRSDGQHHRSVRPQAGRSRRTRRMSRRRRWRRRMAVRVPKVPEVPRCKEGRRRSHERRGLISKDWSVPAVRHHPERRIRNPAKQLDRLLDRIQRIAIAVHDQRPGGDRRERRWREVHVVAIVGELARVAPQRADLIVAVVMAPAHLFPFRFRSPSSVIVRMIVRA